MRWVQDTYKGYEVGMTPHEGYKAAMGYLQGVQGRYKTSRRSMSQVQDP